MPKVKKLLVDQTTSSFFLGNAYLKLCVPAKQVAKHRVFEGVHFCGILPRPRQHEKEKWEDDSSGWIYHAPGELDPDSDSVPERESDGSKV